MITGKKHTNSDSLYKAAGKSGRKTKRGATRDAKDVKDGPDAKRAKRAAAPKDENYIPYASADKHTEDGLAINSFEQQAKSAEFSITNKIEEVSTFRPGQKKWDRLKKKMVPAVDPRAGKIRTESGIWIPSTYKTSRYADWKEKTKIEEQVHRELDESGVEPQRPKFALETRWGRTMANQEKKAAGAVVVNGRKAAKSEIKSADQIVRERMRLDFIKGKETKNKIKKAANRKKAAKRIKAKGKRK